MFPGKLGTGCYASTPWATGVQSNYYSSSSTYVGDTRNAWFANLNSGNLPVYTTGHIYVWPVQSGQ